MLQITRPYEDFSNLLLMLLKFLLIVAIGLQGLRGIVTQLGLDPEAKTGIVNATPLSQTAVDGDFKLSFYPLIYSTRVDSSEVEVEARLCSENCSVDWNALKTGLPEGGPWTALSTAVFTFKRQDETGEEAVQTLAQRLHAEIFSLTGQIPGTYSAVYQVAFKATGEVHRVPQVFTVNFLTRDEGEWRLDPIRIVKGQSSPLPATLDEFQLTAEQNSQLRIRGNNLSLVGQNFQGENFFVEPLTLQTQVGQIGSDDNVFVVGDKTIHAGQARFLLYDQSSDTFVRAEFRQMKRDDRVYYEAAEVDGRMEATLVRFARDRLPVKVPVVVQENLPPRAIYRGQGGRSDTQVLVFFPQDAFTPVPGIRAWFFDLSRHIIDPDGVRAGRPSILVPFENYSKVGTWPSDMDLAKDPDSVGGLLTFNPNTLNDHLTGSITLGRNRYKSMQLVVGVSDDGWRRAVPITLTIAADYKETMDVYKRYLPSGRTP